MKTKERYYTFIGLAFTSQAFFLFLVVLSPRRSTISNEKRKIKMGEAIVLYRGRGSSVDPELLKPTTITSNGIYTAPVTGTYRVSCVGGGGGGGGGCRNSWNSSQVFYGAGGTRGILNTMNITLNAGDKVQVNLGSGGAGGMNNTTVVSNNSRGTNGGSGGTTTFGSYVSGAGGSYGAWSWSYHYWSNTYIWNNVITGYQPGGSINFANWWRPQGIGDWILNGRGYGFWAEYTYTSAGGATPTTWGNVMYKNITMYAVNAMNDFNVNISNEYIALMNKQSNIKYNNNVFLYNGVWIYGSADHDIFVVSGKEDAKKVLEYAIGPSNSSKIHEGTVTIGATGRYSNGMIVGYRTKWLEHLGEISIQSSPIWSNTQNWSNTIRNTTTRCYTSIQQGSWWYTSANNVATSGTRSYRGDGGASGQAGNAGFILIIPPQSA